MDIVLNELVIEVTRRCNMECLHCLRGKAQNLDFDIKYLDRLICAGVTKISSITLSGGEPTMALDIIYDIRNYLMGKNIEVGGFYVAINGSEVGAEFVREMMEWYLFCENNEISQVQISNDEYHDESIIDEHGIELLSTLKFVSEKYSEKYPLSYERIIPQGRALDWGQNRHPIKHVSTSLEVESQFGEVYIEEMVYLNAKGNIVGCCDLSYDTQDEVVICHVSEFKIYIEKMVAKEKEAENAKT